MDDRNQTTGAAISPPIAGTTHAEMGVILKQLGEERAARLRAEQELHRTRQKLEEKVREESEKYRRSARKYEKLVEETNDLIAHLDKKGRITFLNRTAQTLFDLQQQDYFGVSIFRFIHPDDRKKVKAWWRKCIADKANRTSIELRQVNAGTKEVYFLHWSASFHYDEAGRLTGIGAIGRDVSEIRRTEEKADLEKALLEKQLRRRHKMEAIGTLAGGIAHDFNNILAAILGYADMAMEDLPPWSLARNHLHEVVKAGNRAKELVKQILAFSHREEQHREPVSLTALIQEVVVFLRSTIPTTIDILLDLDPNCGPILADQTQIHQVLMNICTNAAQVMDAEGGTLSLSLREVTATEELDQSGPLPLDSPGPLVRLDIADTGPGISDEHLDRIFDPYFTTKEFGTGTGMGLAVVHGIVKNHDGVIRVSKNLPRGTCFSLYFPRTEERIRPPATAATECGPGKERLLVIDDDPSIARMLQVFLNKQGYTTTILSSSKKALEIFRAKPQAFDLVITDQTMPDMTGEELAAKILVLRTDIPIILCTGYSSMIDEEKARQQGIKAFHMKPVALKDLAATVRRLLDKQTYKD